MIQRSKSGIFGGGGQNFGLLKSALRVLKTGKINKMSKTFKKI